MNVEINKIKKELKVNSDENDILKEIIGKMSKENNDIKKNNNKLNKNTNKKINK